MRKYFLWMRVPGVTCELYASTHFLNLFKAILMSGKTCSTDSSSNLSPVFEMVHCACECSGRTPVDHLTFGEFCILSTELHEAYRRKWVSLSFLAWGMDLSWESVSSSAPAPVPKSQLKEKAVLALEERRKKRRPSGAFHTLAMHFFHPSCHFTPAFS